jgi:hydroxymethylglutaryl-CoA lyase
MAAAKIEIVEVGPRDGLQNEKVLLSTEQKVSLIERLIAAGVRRIEAVSFVNPKRVPQMADAEAVMAGVPHRADVKYIGLVMNARGFERALAAGVSEVNFVVVASDTFNRRNQGVGTADSINTLAEVAAAARVARMPLSVVVAAAFGCPFEGEMPIGRLIGVLGKIAEHGPREVALADTIGVGAPNEVTERFAAVKRIMPEVALRAHFHNTRNTGLANAYAAIAAGVTALDASVGGIGGCPFAPAATGNIPTEDLGYMLERMGVNTGLSVPALIETSRWLEGQLGHGVPAMLGRAGVFPPKEQAA